MHCRSMEPGLPETLRFRKVIALLINQIEKDGDWTRALLRARLNAHWEEIIKVPLADRPTLLRWRICRDGRDIEVSQSEMLPREKEDFEIEWQAFGKYLEDRVRHTKARWQRSKAETEWYLAEAARLDAEIKRLKRLHDEE